MSVFVANRLRIAKKTITVYDMVDFKELHRGTKICLSHAPLGTNGGQYFGKDMQMHGKCGKQKKGRENALT